MSSSDSVGGHTSEYACCPLRCGLLHDTSHWGNIVATRPLALVYSFSSAHHAKERPFFQASPPISLVSGALPLPERDQREERMYQISVIIWYSMRRSYSQRKSCTSMNGFD